MKYDFLAPNRIVFGWGRRNELGNLAATVANRVFLVSGSRTLERNGVIDSLESSLASSNLSVQRFSIASREPEVADIDSLVEQILKSGPTDHDCVVAIGGGSTIDLAKAASALVRNRHGFSVADFLESDGRGPQITRKPLNLIAVPTTAGTGAEVTKNSVISSFDPPFKKSLRSDWMVPPIVLVDPELTVSLPPEITAFTGMDAITQLIESYISRRAAPIPRALAVSGLKLALPALPIAVRDGTSREAREAMSQAALLSGMALANSGLGFAHGVAAALGIHCQIAHGLACAVMLPTALRVNQAVSERDLDQLEALFERNSSGHGAAAFIQRIESLCDEIRIPRSLKELGVRPDQVPAIVTGSRGNSMHGNPRDVSDDELTQIVARLL